MSCLNFLMSETKILWGQKKKFVGSETKILKANGGAKEKGMCLQEQ